MSKFRIPTKNEVRLPKKDAVKRIQAFQADMRLEFKRALLGDELLRLEALLDHLIDKHDLQWGDLLALVHMHLQVHRPDAQEEYVRGGHPFFYYGPNRFVEKQKFDKKRKAR